MSIISNSYEWATMEFGDCDLGDRRRVKRLIDYTARQADDPGGSISRACRGDEAAAEGAYRFIRNDHVDPEQIYEGIFQATAARCQGRGTLLSIQDTTDISIAYNELAQEIVQEGCPTGFLVHSALMVDAGNSEIIGWIDQKWWLIDKERPSGKTRKKRQYSDKESYKWEAAHQEMEFRLEDNVLPSIITVGDRESDILEFIQYLSNRDRCYVLRAAQDRCILDADQNKLRAKMEQEKIIETYKITISQRGAQKASGSKQKTRKVRKKTGVRPRNSCNQSHVALVER